MREITRKTDLLPKDKREHCIREIIAFFEEERDEEIGVIAAEEVLDFFLDTIANHVYNEGVDNAGAALRQRFEDLDVDLDMLKKK